MPIYSTDPGDGVPDELDLIENLLADAEALAPAYAWDPETAELTWSDPAEHVLDGDDQGWDDPAEAAGVLEAAVIADARLHPAHDGEAALAPVTALAPPRARRGVEGVAA